MRIPTKRLIMSYIVKSFVPKHSGEDHLCIHCIIKNVSDKYFIVSKGNTGTYLPNVWSDVVTREFTHSPKHFIRDNWIDLSNIKHLEGLYLNESQIFISNLSQEQKFIVDNTYRLNNKSGISFVSVALSPSKVSFNLIGDVFLFFYNRKQNKLRAYCSMIDSQGKFDFSQPCHGLFNDLTLLGNVLSGNKKLGNEDVILIMTKDLANWFIQNSAIGLQETVNSFLLLQDETEFEKTLRQIVAKQRYKGTPFDKESSACVVIQHVNGDKIELYKRKLFDFAKRNKFVMAIITILLCLVFLLKMCSNILTGEIKYPKDIKTEQKLNK